MPPNPHYTLIPFSGITNGNCKYELSFFDKDMVPLILEDRGLTYTPPVFNTLTPSPTYELVQDGYLTIFSEDPTLKTGPGGFDIIVVITSVDYGQNFAGDEFDFKIDYKYHHCSTSIDGKPLDDLYFYQLGMPPLEIILETHSDNCRYEVTLDIQPPLVEPYLNAITVE